ncbi:DUF1080 domain-containing protein [Rhodocytophaga aerolata]|uniref:DUF1080 domain-containing protein n=1 Tax=Rhodocytophaga aerolata TaxID=455078 RepID=A0ABT8R982_9BACT|nr:DUF1080 domain-containing protein [Rhodocytophaga aerolata]MDO1448652.1 DUF1080 domain-containing protein [Rhodocytophaga aerolata]
MSKIPTYKCLSINGYCLVWVVFLSCIGVSQSLLFAAVSPAQEPILGRWDITVQSPNGETPSWLEVKHSGHATLVGYFVGASGSARPISKIEFTGGQLRFSIPPQWETEKNDLVVEGRLQGEQLTGTMTMPNGNKVNWTGTRAPSLRRTGTPTWDKPITLFNGKNLDGWHAQGENQWQAVDGILRSPKSGSNLITDQSFTDFKLHIEFRYPKGSNSGVYLRGRYEVQIADSTTTQPSNDLFAGVYGFIAPSEMVNKQPGEWQTFDITLVGRMVTVEANGKMVICNREIPGITGGALNSKEGNPGPLLLQGDHGPIEYRNIVLTPAKK